MQELVSPIEGNLTRINTGGTAVEYTYDAANRLVGFSDPLTRSAGSYAYNGFGDRVSQTVNGTRTDYLLDLNTSLTQVLGEFTGGESTYYLLGLDVIGQQTSASGWSYFGYDGLGSVRQMTDATGALTYMASYDPYGGLLEQYQPAMMSALGFTGEYGDSNGLTYLRARYYKPDLGIFLNRDPVLGAMGAAGIRWNGYAYAGMNPVNYLDPSGEFFFGQAAVGFGIGAASVALPQIASNLMNGYAWDCHIDIRQVIFAGVQGAVGAGFGFGPLRDFGFGFGWDVLVNGFSAERALKEGMRNLAVGFLVDGVLSGGNPRRFIDRTVQSFYDDVASAGSIQRSLGDGISGARRLLRNMGPGDSIFSDFADFNGLHRSNIEKGLQSVNVEGKITKGDVDLVVLAKYMHERIRTANWFVGTKLTTVGVSRSRGRIAVTTNLTGSMDLKLNTMGGVGRHRIRGIGEFEVIDPRNVSEIELPEWPTGEHNFHVEGILIGHTGDNTDVIGISHPSVPCSMDSPRGKGCREMLETTHRHIPVLWSNLVTDPEKVGK